MLTELTRLWRRWAAHNRVRVTIVFGLVYVAFSRPYWGGLAAGAAVILAGQAIRFWGTGHLEKDVRVARGGPYQLIRHPLYAGSFLMGLGLAVSVQYPLWWTIAYLFLFVGFFLPAIHVEELKLQSIFGPDYQDLMVEVPALIPRFWRTRKPPTRPAETSFDWARVLKNREARSVIAMAALIAMQAAKIIAG